MVHACTATSRRRSRNRSGLCQFAALDDHPGVLTSGQRATLRALTVDHRHERVHPSDLRLWAGSRRRSMVVS